MKKRYQVKKLTGKLEKEITIPRMTEDKDGKPISAGGFDKDTVKVDAGWMVFLPSGASLHIWTEAEMKRQGFSLTPGGEDNMSVEEGSDYEQVAASKSSRPSRENFTA